MTSLEVSENEWMVMFQKSIRYSQKVGMIQPISFSDGENLTPSPPHQHDPLRID